MANGQDKRKLTAILAADVVGYSGLIEADESGTRAALRAHRAEVLDPKITELRGRIVSTAGDSVLAEFASVVDAVRCAAEIQRAMAVRNEGGSEDKRIEFRIGVNVGDVIVEGDDIHGDGVNVAARLESLADPGGVFISGGAFDQVENKLELGYENLGEQKVKNIAKPIQVYRVLLDPEAAGTLITAKVPRQIPTRWVAAAAAVLIVVIGGGAIWNFAIRDDRLRVEAASVERMAFPLPERPSIAVLPFEIIRSDPEQAFLADGITDNITAALSKLRGLFVIAGSSASVYKGQPVPVRQVAEDLGVRYVLEGSIQQSGEDLRVTAQLIDVVSGFHIWSGRYDRKLADVFDVQDEITLKIVQELDVELHGSSQAAVLSGGTESLEAWRLYVEAEAKQRTLGREGIAKGRELWTKAVEIDPEYAAAWAGIALAHLHDIRFGFSEDPEASVRLAVEMVGKALAIDPNEPEALNVLTNFHIGKGENDEAVAAARKAVEVVPSWPDGHAVLAMTLVHAGRYEEAVGEMTQAMRFWPSFDAWYFAYLGYAYTFLDEEDKAIAAFERSFDQDGNPLENFSHTNLAMGYAWFGYDDKAREQVAKALQGFPQWSIDQLKGSFPLDDAAAMERLTESLRRVGLAEHSP